MSDIIVRDFIEEIMSMCLDNEIESNEIPGVIVKMILEIGDEGDVEKLFEEITINCNLDPYGNSINQLEIYESVYNEIEIHFNKELYDVASRYHNANYGYDESREMARNTDYIKQIKLTIDVIDSIIREIKEEFYN